jgi:hypothetical protein
MKEFRTKIHEEIEQYKSGFKEVGRNIPVFRNEDAELNFGENELKILCIAYIRDELDEIEVNYIADALLLSNRVIIENENIADRLGYLTDPEINGHLTKNIVQDFLRQ